MRRNGGVKLFEGTALKGNQKQHHHFGGPQEKTHPNQRGTPHGMSFFATQKRRHKDVSVATVLPTDAQGVGVNRKPEGKKKPSASAIGAATLVVSGIGRDRGVSSWVTSVKGEHIPNPLLPFA